jgi:hypothetical protein
MPERYHQLAGNIVARHKSRLGIEPRTPPHHPPSPIADTLDICPSERYRHRHTYGHGITESRHGCSSASIPALSLSPLSLLSLATVLRSVIFVVWHFRHRYCTRNGVGPSIDSQSIRSPATRKQPACRDKSKVWLLVQPRLCPTFLFVQRHTRQNEYSY